MADQPLFWAVVRDGRGKWVVTYDPHRKITNCRRFAFEAHATEYQRKKVREDLTARAALASKQEDLL